MIKKVYAEMPAKIDAARKQVGRALTLTEKILYAHLHADMQTPSEGFKRSASYVDFAPDRFAIEDATAQMALLQFMSCGRKSAAVPSSMHFDFNFLA